MLKGILVGLNGSVFSAAAATLGLRCESPSERSSISRSTARAVRNALDLRRSSSIIRGVVTQK